MYWFVRILLVLALSLSLGPTPMARPLNPDVKKSVAFIYLQNATGQLVPNGTGFFVQVTSEKHAQRAYLYLVTAKHVVQPGGTQVPEIYVRVNLKTGGSEMVRLPLSSEKGPRMFTHSDSSVDLAVIPLTAPPDRFDYKTIPYELLLASKNDLARHSISEGSEIFFVGLFTGYIGNAKNYPIARFGRVALITDEKIPWGEKELIDAYLMETFSFGGNSGSPVFFYLGPDSKPGVFDLTGDHIYLAGVMKGYFSDKQKVEETDDASRLFSMSNTGIAAVVPSYLIAEILNSPELSGFRRRMDEKL